LIGWPNHPGRLELLSHKGFSRNFSLSLKLHPSDYIAGLSEDDIFYNIFLLFPEYSIIVARNVYISNCTFTAKLKSNNVFFGVNSIFNSFDLFAEMNVALSHDANGYLQSKLLDLPHHSPLLSIRHYCELIG